MTLVGTRPEIIKMSRIINELDKQVNHILVHSGQNYDYELNQVFFDDLEIRKPDHFLAVAQKTLAQTIAAVISKSDEVFKKENPDALLLYGDTNSSLSIIAAKRRKIPIFHMEAGNRCFDQRVPEELNRKIIDHLSDINLVLTEHARRYLIAEGIRPETIIKTGSHMNEVLQHYMPNIQASNALIREKLTEGKFIIVSMHREETVDTIQNFNELLESLVYLAETFKYPLIISVHPRTRQKIDKKSQFMKNPLIRLHKPFGFFDYIKLQMSAFCVVSDSGTITEEASILNLPAITIRNTHERPEGMDEGTLVMSGLKKERVVEAVRLITSQHQQEKRLIPAIRDYQSSTVSKQIVRIVFSYTDYINRTVWSKL